MTGEAGKRASQPKARVWLATSTPQADTRGTDLPWNVVPTAPAHAPSVASRLSIDDAGNVHVRRIEIEHQPTDPDPGITEDAAHRLVRYIYAQARRESIERKMWATLTEDTVEDLRNGLPSRITDEEFAGIYRLLTTRTPVPQSVEDGLATMYTHEPAMVMAELLHVAHGTIRNRLVRLRKAGVLGPADGTRAGEKAPPRKPRKRTAPPKTTAPAKTKTAPATKGTKR